MTCHDALKLAQGKGLQRHVAELNRLCDAPTIEGIIDGCRQRVNARVDAARTHVHHDVARSIAD